MVLAFHVGGAAMVLLLMLVVVVLVMDAMLVVRRVLIVVLRMLFSLPVLAGIIMFVACRMIVCIWISRGRYSRREPGK